MNTQDYSAFHAVSNRLSEAANRIFNREIPIQEDMAEAYVGSVTFFPDECVVAYNHCRCTGCDDWNHLRIPTEKLLAELACMESGKSD